MCVAFRGWWKLIRAGIEWSPVLCNSSYGVERWQYVNRLDLGSVLLSSIKSSFSCLTKACFAFVLQSGTSWNGYLVCQHVRWLQVLFINVNGNYLSNCIIMVLTGPSPRWLALLNFKNAPCAIYSFRVVWFPKIRNVTTKLELTYLIGVLCLWTIVGGFPKGEGSITCGLFVEIQCGICTFIKSSLGSFIFHEGTCSNGRERIT